MQFDLTLSERSFWVHCVVGGRVAWRLERLPRCPPGEMDQGCAHRQRDAMNWHMF